VGLLLRAYAELRRLGSTHRLVLAGQTGPTAEDLRLLTALALDGWVEILTAVPPKTLRELYRNADCLVMTSREEGLGLVALEAMACGTPVVATWTAGTAFTLPGSGAGHLLPADVENKPAALAVALHEVTANPTGGAACKVRQHVVSRFSLDAVVEPFLTAYAELTERGDAR
jgi:glycosyltransferase involved in cell wall biosynthesis